MISTFPRTSPPRYRQPREMAVRASHTRRPGLGTLSPAGDVDAPLPPSLGAAPPVGIICDGSPGRSGSRNTWIGRTTDAQGHHRSPRRNRRSQAMTPLDRQKMADRPLRATHWKHTMLPENMFSMESAMGRHGGRRSSLGRGRGQRRNSPERLDPVRGVDLLSAQARISHLRQIENHESEKTEC